MPDGPTPEEALLGGVVVVETAPYAQGGMYGLVPASEWCSGAKTLTLWRGPGAPEEKIDRGLVREAFCQAVHVDPEGNYVCTPAEIPVLYPCPQLTEAVLEAVEEEARPFLDAYANERAAEGSSYLDSERAREEFGEEVWTIARFGDAVAVDGELVFTARGARPPRGWVVTDFGGRHTSGEEEEIDRERLAEPIAEAVSKRLVAEIEPWIVEKALDRIHGPKPWIMWTSDSGETEVWVSRRAAKEYEKKLEKRRMADEERRRAEELKRRREAEERRLREERERRERIRRGGWPTPREWSPRGRLPGE